MRYLIQILLALFFLLVSFNLVDHVLLNQFLLSKLRFYSSISNAPVIEVVGVPWIGFHKLKVCRVLVIHVLKPLISDQVGSQFILSDLCACFFSLLFALLQFLLQNIVSLLKSLILDCLNYLNSFIVILLFVKLVIHGGRQLN